MSEVTYTAVLGYDDPENGIPERRIIASGTDLGAVFGSGLTVYEALLQEQIAYAKVGIVRSKDSGLKASLHALDSIRLGIYEGDPHEPKMGRLLLKVGGELE